MDYFMELLTRNSSSILRKSFFVDGLVKKMEDAKVLRSLDDDFDGHLVYLED
jgi:hypothetical protein